MITKRIFLTFFCSFQIVSHLISQDNRIFYEVSSPSSFIIIKEGYPVNLIPPSFFIKNYVEKNMAEWQKKGEFEKSADFAARINEASRNKQIQLFTNEAEVVYKKEFAKTIGALSFQIGQYDADKETFLVKSGVFGDIILPVPIDEAQSLKQNWDRVIYSGVELRINGNKINLSKLIIMNPLNSKYYVYDPDKSSGNPDQNAIDDKNPLPTNPGKTINQTIVSNYGVYSYSELTDYLMKAINANDFDKAKELQNEITKRELSGKYSEIPVERLEIMLQEVIKTEDFSKAALIQDELNLRKK